MVLPPHAAAAIAVTLLIGTSTAAPPARLGVAFPLEDRDGWAWLAEHPTLAGIVERAESQIESLPPETPDELFLEFSRNGNRSKYQKPYFAKRQRLADFVVAEGIENRGRFVPAIERYLRAICEERVWCVPAHDRDLGAFDGKRVELDLFLSETSWDLAMIARLLESRLSPEVLRLVDKNLQRRTFGPYEAILAGEADPPWWFRTTNNWNAVCLAGITGAALTHLESPARRQRYLDAAEEHIKKFLSGFADDGYCTEGVGYWNFGFGHYLMLGEAIGRSTDGRSDWFASDRVRTIATYPSRILIEPRLTPWFADCRPGTTPSRVLQEHLAAKLGVAGPLAGSPPHTRARRLHLYALSTLYPTLRESSTKAPKRTLPVRDRFDDAGVFLFRPNGPTDNSFAVAAKAGHNGEHHNHNDVGTFTVARNGVAVLCDPGGEVYTASTFGPRRYRSPFMNSFGQPVPIVAGEPQAKGSEHHGKVVSTTFTNQRDSVAMDLTLAYAVPSLEQLERTFTYQRAGDRRLVVEDRVRFDSPQAFEASLLTFEPVEILGGDRLVVGEGPSAVEVLVESDGGAVTIALTTLDGESVTKKPVTRIGLAIPGRIQEAMLRTTIRPAPSSGTIE